MMTKAAEQVAKDDGIIVPTGSWSQHKGILNMI